MIFTTVFGFCLVALLSVIGFSFAEPIVRMFQKEASVIEIGTPALRYATVGLLFLPLSVPVNMLYQSIRKAGVASFLSILRSGAVLIPVLLIGVHFLDLTGILLAQPVSDCITGLICLPFIIYFLKKTPDGE